MGAPFMARAVPRLSGGLSQAICAATATLKRFSPSASRPNSSRGKKSLPSAVLRSSLRPARASRVLARSPGFFQPLPEGPTA
jgi:hypothetical protein